MSRHVKSLITPPHNRLFRTASNEAPKLNTIGPFEGNSLGTGGFLPLRAGVADRVSILWRHQAICCWCIWTIRFFTSHIHSFTGDAFLQILQTVTPNPKQHMLVPMLCTAQLPGPVLKAFGWDQISPFQMAYKPPWSQTSTQQGAQ